MSAIWHASSYLIALCYGAFALIVAARLNPLLVDAYKSAQISIPDSVAVVITLDWWLYVPAALLVAAGLVIKDRRLRPAPAMFVNVFAAMALAFFAALYFQHADLMHAPL